MKTLDRLIEALEEMIENPTKGDFENEGYYIAKDSLYYLKEYQDTIKKLENCQKENQKLKKRVEKLESDAAWDADYRRGQVQGMW